MSFKGFFKSSLIASVLVSALGYAEIRVIDFDFGSNGAAINNGDVISNQYSAWGLQISSCLIAGSALQGTNQVAGICDTTAHDEGRQVAFDTSLTNTRDEDLEVREVTQADVNNNPNITSITDPTTGAQNYVTAETGQLYPALDEYVSYYENLSNDAEIQSTWQRPGNVLILNEQNTCNGVPCGPDDEGARPAGFFKFEFSNPVDILNIDFFDIESNEASSSSPNNAIFFSIKGQSELVRLNVPDTGGSNLVRKEYTNLFNVESFVLNMPGSGAIDNLVFRNSVDGSNNSGVINAPLSLGLFSFALIALLRRRAM
ncbi:hypothetical protein [Glaciecola sp. KUL10]|uniref:hypothetical protein n=1 Tax=Glaciecola sp. (strain KUL10) TaxID=2161813 RepID=UPI000D7830E2|nr:hypothetical protein [Glaciecola sp. KUL10]GBL04632.1 hypothetical protein KUL10_19410 [Glaciecola sp. KUL10]